MSAFLFLHMTKISIILPVYNTEAYLEQAIQSVLDQTYQNWELIAINDASTDGSLEILERYKKTERRVKLFDFEKNKGQGFVRNFGLNEAHGDYIVFLDSDDFLASKALEILNDNILKKPNTEVFVWGFTTCTAKGKKGKPNLPAKPKSKNGETHFQLGMLSRKGCQPVAWVYAVKRSLIEKHDIKFAEGIYFEDIIFSTQILWCAKKVGVIKKPCYYYRKHQGSITGKASKQKIDDKFTAHVLIKTFLEEQGAFGQYQGLYLIRFLTLCVRTSFNEYLALPMKEKDKELDDYMDKIRKSNLLKKENLLLLLNTAFSIPKNEKVVRNTYISAYFSLKAIKKRYTLYRLFIKFASKIHRTLKRISQ